MGGNDFAKRFNLTIDEKAEFKEFRNKIVGLFKGDIRRKIESSSVIKDTYLIFLGKEDYDRWDFVERFIEETEDLLTLIKNIECLFKTLKNTSHEDIALEVYELIEIALALSPHIPIQITKNDGKIIFYPKGAPILDKELINDVLNGLTKYSDANKAFNDALQKYETNNNENYRNLLDDLRVALEQILKSILKNNIRLEKQSTELKQWLQNKNINQQTIKNVCSLLFENYTFLQNEEVKHSIGKFKPAEIEYLIYQTGLFLRFLIELDK